MTRSKKILIDAGRDLRGKVLSIADNAEFEAFRREMFDTHGITKAALARIAGVELKHVVGKGRGDAAYEGKPLTLDQHGNPDRPADFNAWWLENCPDEFRTQVFVDYINRKDLSEALDRQADGYVQAQEDMIQSLYRDGLGREGEPKGVADHLKELKAGRSFYAKALDFYWSPEAVEQRNKGEVA